MNTAGIRNELLHGQRVFLPTKAQWRQIVLDGELDGRPVPIPDWILNWVTEMERFRSAELGVASYLRQDHEVWRLIPLLINGGRYLRVHFEDVICEHCDERCGISAAPDSVSYACTGLSYEEIFREFELLPVKSCPHCGGVLNRRQTRWFGTDDLLYGDSQADLLEEFTRFSELNAGSGVN